MNTRTLKAKNLKRDGYVWTKGGFTVYKLWNGYWLSSFEWKSEQFATLGELKKQIIKHLKR